MLSEGAGWVTIQPATEAQLTRTFMAVDDTPHGIGGVIICDARVVCGCRHRAIS